MTIEIRPARPADAEQLARVHVRSWQAGYRGILPADYLDGLSLAGRPERWRQRLAEGDTTVHAALLDGRVVGFAAVGASRDEDLPPARWLELQSCYLLPRAWGTGVAQQLAHVALPAEPPMFLWVFAANLRAQAFYRKLGFCPDGTEKPITIGGATVTEERWRRERPNRTGIDGGAPGRRRR